MVATWSASGVISGANTLQALPLACPVQRVWNWERKALRTGDAIAVSFSGDLLIAWRRQFPGAPRSSARRLLMVLSKPIGQNAPDPI